MNETWFNECIEFIAHPDAAPHLASEFECFFIEVRDEIVILDVLILHRLFDPEDDFFDLLIGIIAKRNDAPNPRCSRKKCGNSLLAKN